MFCHSCRTELPEEANYCWHCGWPQKVGLAHAEPRWETCEIVYEQKLGVLTCRFWARAIGANGEYSAGESGWWLGKQPAAHNLEAVAAHRALVRGLTQAGWQHTGLGPVWFNDRFQRRIQR